MDQIKIGFANICQEAQKDAAQVELLLSKSESLNLKYSKSKLEKFESTDSQAAGLRVILSGSQGYASTENTSPEALLRSYKEALSNAQTLLSGMVLSGKSTSIPLAQPATVTPMEDLCIDEDISIEKKMACAQTLESACYGLDSRIQSVPYPNWSENTQEIRVLNSNGLDQKFKRKFYSGYCYPLAKEGESSKMDGETFFAREFSQIDPQAIAAEGVRRCTERLGARKIPTGRYAVVIDRQQMDSILAMISSYFSAKSLFDGKSLLAGLQGQKIASPLLQLCDDPFDRRGSNVRPFDAEGVPTQKTVLIENGVLKNFLTNLEYADKMQLPVTGNASRSPASALDISATTLSVRPGQSALSEMLASHEEVFHLTNFAAGLHSGFKSATGDFSMPSEGFLYKNGKRVGPVDQIVVAGNVLELLQDIEMVGNELNKPGQSFLAPDILIRSLSIAGS